jgi:glycosyltransferase involved in cell wall biosynthesis
VSVPRIAAFLDSPDEGWRAMDLCGEMLVREWTAMPAEVEPTPFTIRLPRAARHLPLAPQTAWSTDRLIGRFLTYPAYAARQRSSFDFFHVVDHSYAQLVHVLPHARTGVYCHDLDTFRCVLDPDAEPRPAWFRTMALLTLRGMTSAALVFYSTNVVREAIERAGLVAASRLVQAPLGVAPGLDAVARDDREAVAVLAPLGGRPYLLHVGSGIARKRLDVLFETFGRLHAQFPELRLVQNGAVLDAAQRALVARAGIAGALFQPPERVTREVLGALYRRASAVLVTSDSEGFGIPVIEALACGATVFASDIPVLREVGGGAVVHCRAGDPEHWAATLAAFLAGALAVPPREARIAQGAKFTWEKQARTILDAYRGLR